MHVLLVLFSIDIAKAFSQNRLAYMTVLTISFVVVFVVGFCANTTVNNEAVICVTELSIQISHSHFVRPCRSDTRTFSEWGASRDPLLRGWQCVTDYR